MVLDLNFVADIFGPGPLVHKPLHDIVTMRAIANTIMPELRAGLALGTAAIIVGGAPRDLYHGKMFKDIDIIIVGGKTTVERVIYLLLKAGCTDVRPGSDVENEYDDNPLDWVVKARYLGVDIDVIQWRRNDSLHEVLEQFDLNLNAFFMTGPHLVSPMRSTAAPEQLGSPITLGKRAEVDITTPKMQARILKLHDKYKMEYNWHYDNRIISVVGEPQGGVDEV